MGPAGAVRAGNYKLVEVFEAGKAELYHLRNDLGETHDLAASMPDLAWTRRGRGSRRDHCADDITRPFRPQKLRQACSYQHARHRQAPWC